MPLFKRKQACPLCGRSSVEVEQGSWVCTFCIANGPVSQGQILDLGLRGWPRGGGQFEQYQPAQPVALQLYPQAPEALKALVQDPEASERFTQAACQFFLSFSATTFDIEDPDLEEAVATRARALAGEPSLRADDPRFYTLTAIVGCGWQWRRAEEGEDTAEVVEETKHWHGIYRGEAGHSRSEVIGLTALAIADTAALENRLYPDTDSGYASLLGGWLISHAMFLASQPDMARLFPREQFLDAFRFGVGIRDAEVAYDPTAASLNSIAAQFDSDDMLGEAVSNEVRAICREHGMEIGELYVAARQQVTQGKEAGEGEFLIVNVEMARRGFRILVASAAELITEQDDQPLNVAYRAVTAAQETGNEQMIETATAHYDTELVKLIEQAGLTSVVETLEGMIIAESLDEATN